MPTILPDTNWEESLAQLPITDEQKNVLRLAIGKILRKSRTFPKIGEAEFDDLIRKVWFIKFQPSGANYILARKRGRLCLQHED
ncbi:MAG: hypothetical protein WC250_00010 [Candidatus Paceibacterota bacterium]|jgi:hypothetical protein